MLYRPSELGWKEAADSVRPVQSMSLAKPGRVKNEKSKRDPI